MATLKISMADFSRQQPSKGFRGAEFEVNDVLAITMIGEYQSQDPNALPRHYVQFENVDGDTFNMPLGDCKRHKGLGEKSADGENWEFANKYQIADASDRIINKKKRYPMACYFTDALHEEEIRAKLGAGQANKIDWMKFYGPKGQAKAEAQDDGSEDAVGPIQDYVFTKA